MLKSDYFKSKMPSEGICLSKIIVTFDADKQKRIWDFVPLLSM